MDGFDAWLREEGQDPTLARADDAPSEREPIARTSVLSIDEIRRAVRESAEVVADYGTGSTVSEVADTALDLLAEKTVALDAEEVSRLEVEVERAVFAAAGLDSGSSDAAAIDRATLLRLADPSRVVRYRIAP